MGKGKLELKRIGWVAGGVLLLAAVILAGAALSSPKKATQTAERTPTPAEQAEQLASSADAAASALQTDQALALATKALAIDGGNVTARRIIDRLKPKPTTTTTKPASDAGSKGSSKPAPPADAYQTKSSNIAVFLPKSASGWIGGRVVKDRANAIVTFEPTSSNQVSKRAVRAVVTVHDRGSAGKATSFASILAQKVYGQDTESIRAGRLPAHFGTDGDRQAAVIFARGRYAFEVVVIAQPNQQAIALHDDVVSFAGNVPATR